MNDGTDVPKPRGDDEPLSEDRPAPADNAASDVSEEVVQAFEEELAAANRRADELRGQMLLAQADLENYRRAAERRRSEAVVQERRRLLTAFLRVVDNLERALSHANADADDVIAGVEATNRELQRLLEAEGVAPIQALEEGFDPNVHEAVSVVEMPHLDTERVVAVELSGYMMDGELLRPARVVVGQPAGATDSDD